MKKAFFARIIVGSLFAAVAAGTWDVWWHGALGRESFWSPPHLFLYAAVIVGIGTGWYAWRMFRELVWRRVALLLALIPLSAPLDELWHRLFGVENISSPAIIWSPPHLLLIVGIIASLVALLPLLRTDEDKDARRLFGSITFAVILTLLFFVTGPFEPTGPLRLLGFPGAGIIAAVLVGVLLSARQWIPGIAGATLSAAFFLLLSSMNFGEQVAAGVVIPPHDHAPPWLTIFAAFIPAVFLDLFGRRLPLWAQGGAVGFLWSFILYGFASYFFEPQFQYGAIQTLTAIGSSTLGGIVVGGIVTLVRRGKALPTPTATSTV